ncbi:MAG: DNA polymerase IV [bacterium]
MERIILHIDMDAFFAQIEERENPQFKGKPIVIGADPKNGKGRGVVSTANYEARKHGIHSAMPISWAWRACPEAIFLPVNMALYERASGKIMGLISKYSSSVEKRSVDEAYLDLSSLLNRKPGKQNLEAAYKKAEEIAKKIKKEILKKEKLPCTIGIGPNKMIAKMATNSVKPNGLIAISPEKVKEFIGPQDTRKMPGIGPKTAEQLKKMGVNTISDIRNFSEDLLVEKFGIMGETILKRAFGIDEEELITEEEIKSIGKEHTFEKDTRDAEEIFTAFEKIIKGVYEEVKENHLLFRCITVICRFSGFETHTKAKSLKQATADYSVLNREAKKLLLRFLVKNFKKVRLVGLRLSSFVDKQDDKTAGRG